MIETIAANLDVSTRAVWGLAGLLAVQLLITVWALIDLAGRPRVRFDKKWIWALIIIFLGNSFIGPILYVAIGRNVPEDVDVKTGVKGATNDERTRRAVDTLYGEGDGR